MNPSLIVPSWPAPKNVKALTTTKKTWGDYPENERQSQLATDSLIMLGDLPSNPCWLKQVHGTHVVAANPINTNKPEADAAYTTKLETVCSIITADCLPVLICDKNGQQVAAVHAGWRGLANGILESTLEHFSQKGLIAWLGPAIGAEKFEVGRDVYSAFTDNQPDANKCFSKIGDNKWLADLYELARIRLNKYGVDDVYGGKFCTHTQSDLFYSYRRDGSKAGRMASLIWLTND